MIRADQFACHEGPSQIPSLKLRFSHLKMDGWNTSFLLGWRTLRCKLLVLGSVSIQMMVLIVLASLPVVIPLSFLLVG